MNPWLEVLLRIDLEGACGSVPQCEKPLRMRDKRHNVVYLSADETMLVDREIEANRKETAGCSLA
jgi:hypothetical protein